MPCADHAGRGAQRCCRECSFHDGIVAVKPFTNKRAWSILLTIGDHEYKVSFKRKQMPLTTSKASTLHVLQGSTAAPGLIFHWKFPRRLSQAMRWLATYVALSRVEHLANFRSVGLTGAIRKIIEGGPPEGLPQHAWLAVSAWRDELVMFSGFLFRGGGCESGTAVLI